MKSCCGNYEAAVNASADIFAYFHPAIYTTIQLSNNSVSSSDKLPLFNSYVFFLTQTSEVIK